MSSYFDIYSISVVSNLDDVRPVLERLDEKRIGNTQDDPRWCLALGRVVLEVSIVYREEGSVVRRELQRPDDPHQALHEL